MKINEQLIMPKSIVVVGGSNDISKIGGKILYNIIQGGYAGDVFVINPKESEVQGKKSYSTPEEVPPVDMAIIALPVQFVKGYVEVLCEKAQAKAFIILSAGFSEMGDEGRKLEQNIVEIINKNNGALIGPNCIGVITEHYNGIFAGPVPKLDPKGCDFVSGSGATAAFIIETGINIGLSFANLFSVGNSAQINVEDVLEYWDETFDPLKSSKIKLMYIENIDDPFKLYKHCVSLINKGCRIAVVKSGATEAGSRATSSHTGALATPEVAVDALLKKAGVVRCHGREDLVLTAAIFTLGELKGKNIAIVTHAGGPGVMLTDALSKGGLGVPQLTGEKAEALLEKLYPGSSVLNPIDFLATGTAEQLELIIDALENDFSENIDGIAVIFGTPGLFDISNVYKVLHKKMSQSKTPIFPILPSITTASKEIELFKSFGSVFFSDEVTFGRALSNILNSKPPVQETVIPNIDKAKVRKVIENSKEGFISPEENQALLDAAGITRAKEKVVRARDEAIKVAKELGYPLVMKVVGPVHKSDIGGVSLDVQNEETVYKEFERLMSLKDATAVMMQPLLNGIEIFVGCSYSENFGHTILCGLGGIFIEVLNDTAAGMSPVGKEEAKRMISSLKGYKVLEGIRGQEGVNIDHFAEIITKLSALLEVAPEIKELDINPLIGNKDKIVAVDARIRV